MNGPTKVYRLSIAPVLHGMFGISAGCRFYPTCSRYSEFAVKKYGIFWGVFMSLVRILRCNPFFFGGYDPLP